MDGWMDDNVSPGTKMISLAFQHPQPVGGRADFTGSTQKFALENQKEQTPREKDEVGKVERATWRLPCSDQAHKGQKKDPLLDKGRGT